MNFLKPLYLHEDKPLSFWFKGEFFFGGGEFVFDTEISFQLMEISILKGDAGIC